MRWRRVRHSIAKRFLLKPLYGDYSADGISVRRRSLHFIDDARFAQAWLKAKKANEPLWRGNVPDIRWRAHIACWAAAHGLSLEGDFVECGVFGGLLSLTICHFLDFTKVGRTFWLYDTWAGIPPQDLEGRELDRRAAMNVLYAGSYETAQRNFALFPNARLVRGRVPDTLSEAPEKVAYLSLDMNNARAEIDAISFFWDRLTHSAVVVLDDYGWAGHERQRDALDEFAASKGRWIACLPTGQGLLIKA